MQTLSQLRTRLQTILWPDGEAENLVTAHNKAFIEALIDLQKWVDCLQYNNVDVIENCAQYFQCGATVFQAPKGSIFRVSTFDRIDALGNEDPNARLNFCGEVIYQYVDYCTIRKIVDSALCGLCTWPLASAFPGNCGYPAPTNAQYQGYPQLPLGFEYPQASLDRTGNCITGQMKRATQGVWAMNNGRIYMAPWLQSTEVAAIQWNGINRTWANSDLVNSAPDYEEAIKFYVWWVHFRDYEKDYEAAGLYKGEYERVRAFLIRDCREETRDHTCEPSLAKQNITSLQSQSTGVITTAPVAPTDLEAEVISDGQIDLQWQYSLTNAAAYVIEQKFTTDDVEEWIVVGTSPTTSVSVTGLDAETEYCFRVRAQNTNGNSDPTDEVCATTEAQTEQYNLDFNSTVPTTKTGSAAIGEDGDYWNTFGASQGAAAMALRRADNTLGDVTIEDTGTLGGTFGSNGNTDPMLSSFFSLQSTPYQKQFTIRNLVAGNWDIYVYGYSNVAGSSGGNANAAGRFIFHKNGIQFPDGATTYGVGNNSNAPPYTQSVTPFSAGNYIKCPSIPVVDGDVISVTAFYGGGTKYGVISGLQLVKI